MNCLTTIYEAEILDNGRDLLITADEHYEGYDDSVRYYISVFDFDVVDEVEVKDSTKETLYQDFLEVLNRYKTGKN